MADSGTATCNCGVLTGGDWTNPIICACTKPVPWTGKEPSNPICQSCKAGNHEGR